MTSPPLPRLRRSALPALRAALVSAAALALAACVAERQEPAAAAQPASATYACGDDGTLRVEAAGSTVRVTHLVPRDAEAEADLEQGDAAVPEMVQLVASPPGQTSRFDQEGYALVVDGSEALYMKAGSAPLTCVR